MQIKHWINIIIMLTDELLFGVTFPCRNKYDLRQEWFLLAQFLIVSVQCGKDHVAEQFITHG